MPYRTWPSFYEIRQDLWQSWARAQLCISSPTATEFCCLSSLWRVNLTIHLGISFSQFQRTEIILQFGSWGLLGEQISTSKFRPNFDLSFFCFGILQYHVWALRQPSPWSEIGIPVDYNPRMRIYHQNYRRGLLPGSSLRNAFLYPQQSRLITPWSRPNQDSPTPKVLGRIWVWPSSTYTQLDRERVKAQSLPSGTWTRATKPEDLAQTTNWWTEPRAKAQIPAPRAKDSIPGALELQKKVLVIFPYLNTNCLGI